MRPPARHVVHGVDFSAAEKDAGSRIWIATGVVRGERLRIVDLRRATELSDWGSARTPALAALRRFIADRPTCVFGLDFPFGVPLYLAGTQRWEDFLAAFAALYGDAQALRARCGEARRVTDRECRAPLAPGNLRLYRQTYFGIRDVLWPLVRDEKVSVLPMQYRRRDRPWVIEICPAATLAREGLPTRYKGPGEALHALRARILDDLRARGVALSAETYELAAVERHGDALDAVVAAVATWRALGSGFPRSGQAEHLVEGCIFA